MNDIVAMNIAKHKTCVFFDSTYGDGDAPSPLRINSGKNIRLSTGKRKKLPVARFGDTSFPDCGGFAKRN